MAVWAQSGGATDKKKKKNGPRAAGWSLEVGLGGGSSCLCLVAGLRSDSIGATYLNAGSRGGQ